MKLFKKSLKITRKSFFFCNFATMFNFFAKLKTCQTVSHWYKSAAQTLTTTTSMRESKRDGTIHNNNISRVASERAGHSTLL